MVATYSIHLINFIQLPLKFAVSILGEDIINSTTIEREGFIQSIVFDDTQS
jgi:hypothetical protein